MATKNKNLFMVHVTYGLCDYNEHFLFDTYEKAKEHWLELYEIHKKAYAENVYYLNEEQCIFYYEDRDTNCKLYITKHEL